MTDRRVGTRFRAFFAALTVLSLAGTASWVSARQASPAVSAPAPAQTPAAAPAPVAAAPLASIATPPVAVASAQKPPAVARPAASKAPARSLDKPLWHTLTRQQQTVLQPLAADWDKMEGVKKQKWLEIANKFPSMKPDEQQRVHERMRNWAVELTPEQRRVARENFAQSKKLAPSQKSAQWEQYQQLPEAEKKRLAAAAALKKKQVANLPNSAQSKLPKVAPIKSDVSVPPANVPNVPVVSAPPPAPAVSAPAAAAPAATAPAPVPNGK